MSEFGVRGIDLFKIAGESILAGFPVGKQGTYGPLGNPSVVRWKNSSSSISNIILWWPATDVVILAPHLLRPTKSPHLCQSLSPSITSSRARHMSTFPMPSVSFSMGVCSLQRQVLSKTNFGSGIEPRQKRREKSPSNREGSTGLQRRPPCPKRGMPIWSFCMLGVRPFPLGKSFKRRCWSFGLGARRPVCRKSLSVWENAGPKRSGKPRPGSDVLMRLPVDIS